MSVPESNARVVRRAATQAFTGAAVCAVAWQVIAGPVRERLVSASAAGAQQAVQMRAFSESINSMPVRPESIIESAQTRAARLEELSRETGDASALYEALASVAKEAGVHIDRIEPRQSSQSARGPGRQSVESTSFSVEVTGDFDAMVRFVDRTEAEIGLTRVTGLRIRPTIADAEDGNKAMLATTVETTHFRLPMTLEERVKAAESGEKSGKGPKDGGSKR
jgi:hypothetical protein